MSAFLTIAFIHLLAIASPGPDFAIIVKQSISQPRRVVLWTALGVALGIFVHITYSLLGIGLIIAQSIVLFSLIKVIGAGYLLFIGWKALMTKRSSHQASAHHHREKEMSALSAVKIGFLCNVLNPKVTLFFLALFTQIMSPSTPLLLQLFYGLYLSLATFIWFSMLGSILTMDIIRHRIEAIHLWAERVMGAVLILLGLKVAFAARK